MNTFTCIWCRTTTDIPSLEHILQCSLGARAARTDITCGGCNNSFTQREFGAIDVALAEQFAFVRNALLIWSGRDRPPPTLRDVGESDGVPFDLAPGFLPVFRRVVRRQVQLADGRKVFEVIAPNRAATADQCEHLRRQYGPTLHVEKVASQASPVPTVSMHLHNGGRKALRAVAKSLFNLAATALPREAILGPAFDTMRDAVRYDRGALTAGHDYVNPFPAVASIGDFDHALQIVADPVQRDVRGYASLFGHFRFSGVLAHDVDLGPVTATLVQDPIGRTRRQERTSTAAHLPFDPQVPSSLRDNFDAASAGMRTAYNAVMTAAMAAAPAQVAETAVQELMTRLEKCTTKEQRDAAVTAFCMKFASMVCRVPFEEVIEPSELGF